jgi:cell division protein FtsZ
MDEIFNEPAYKRNKIKLEGTKKSSESDLSRLSLFSDENGVQLKPNRFLHDNVD